MRPLWAVFLVAAPAVALAQAPAGPEFQVNSFTSGRQSRPSVASDAAGNVVVVWSSAGRDGSEDGVFARRYDAGGVATGDEFQVNTFTTESQDRPFVASDPAGNFVVVWDSDGQDGSGKGIVGQRFDAAGARRGAEF